MAEDQDVQDIEGAVDHMVPRLTEVRNLDLVDLEDHLAYQMEVLVADVTFGDEEDKGMAAAVECWSSEYNIRIGIRTLPVNNCGHRKVQTEPND